MRLGYGATAIGRYPELIRAGVPVALGCDGGNCSNFFDMVRAMHLVATLYKDARRDVSLVPAEIMGRIYFALLEEIEARRFRVLEGRITVPARRKLAIAVRCWAGARRRAAAGAARA